MSEKKHYSIVRTIYLYIFALLGLIFTIIGTVRMVDMGLKFFIFTKAEEQQRISYKQPIVEPYRIQKVEEIQGEDGFTEEEKELAKEWLEDYKKWKEETDNIDYANIRRHQDAASSFSFIFVGLPLYFYHWKIIKKETGENKKES